MYFVLDFIITKLSKYQFKYQYQNIIRPMFQNNQSSLTQSPTSKLKLSSQQYSHLTVRQIKQSVNDYPIDYYTPIQTHFKPLNKTANKIEQLMHDQSLKQQMIYALVNEIKRKDPSYKRLKQMIKQQIQQKGYNISQMQSRRKTFAIDCFREVMSYPFKCPHAEEEEIMGYNFLAFWRLYLQKQLRRVLWQKSLINEQTKQQFFTYDHELTPYNIQMQFRLTIQRIAQKQGIKLKQLQKDMAIKLLQYTVKRTQTLPNRSQVYMALNIVQLFSYYNISRVNEIGAVHCGLETLAEYYYEPIMQKRLQRLLKVIEYVDTITFSFLNKYFFSNPSRSHQARQQLNEIYEHFRLSLTSRYLPLNTSQYIIDQLLIKKRSLIDMYIMFGIVILVLGDYIEKVLDIKEDDDLEGNQFLKDFNSKNINMNTNGSPVKNGDKINNNNINLANINNNSTVKPNLNNPTTTTKPLQKSPLVQKLQSSPKKYKQQQQSSLLASTSNPTGVTIKQIFQQSKQTIKLQQIVQAFNVVFQKIPATFSSTHKLSQTNRLFAYMLEVENQSLKKSIQDKNLMMKQMQGLKTNANPIDNNSNTKQQLLLDQEKLLMKQLQQLKKQQQKPIGTLANNFNNFLIAKNDKLNYQRLGRRK